MEEMLPGEKSSTPAPSCPKINTHTQGNGWAVPWQTDTKQVLPPYHLLILKHCQIAWTSLNPGTEGVFSFFLTGWEIIWVYWLDKGAALQTSVPDGPRALQSCGQGTSAESLWSRERHVYENESKLGLNKINRDLIELCELELQSRATY